MSGSVAPGVCVICQEQPYQGDNPKVDSEVTVCLDDLPDLEVSRKSRPEADNTA